MSASDSNNVTNSDSDTSARAYRSMTPSPEPPRRSRSPGPAGRTPEMEGFPEIRSGGRYFESLPKTYDRQGPAEARTWSPGPAGRTPELEGYPEIEPESRYIVPEGYVPGAQPYSTVNDVNAALEDSEVSRRSPSMSLGRVMDNDQSKLSTGTELEDSSIQEPEGSRIEVDEFATLLAGGSPRLRRRTLTVSSTTRSGNGAGVNNFLERSEDPPPPYTW